MDGDVVEDAQHVDNTDNEGWTALHRAAKLGRIEVTKFLLEHGANLEAKTNNGW